MTKSSSTYGLFSKLCRIDDSIKMGFTVLIGAQPAPRIGVQAAHGGVITAGCPQVLIGG